MPLRPRSAALAVLLASLSAFWLVPGAAQAVPRSPDPERVVVPATPTARVAAKAPATIDSDVYASVASSTSRNYFVTAGHLKLRLKGGSSTKYTGTYTDHSGGKTTKASASTADPDAPTVTIKTSNGNFTFRGTATFGGGFYTATATKVPKKIGFKASALSLVGATHSLKTATYQVVLTERVGPVAKPFEHTGSLTLAYDANNRVSGGAFTVVNGKGKTVTNAIKSSGYVSPGSYFYTVVKADKTTIGISATFSGASFTGFGVSGSGAKTAQWVVTGTS
jgi:hypothetical protein